MITYPARLHPGTQPWVLFLLAARQTHLAAHPELAARLRDAEQRVQDADPAVFRAALKEISDIAEEAVTAARTILDKRWGGTNTVNNSERQR